MKILFKNLSQYEIQKLIICSIEQALYQAVVVINGAEHLVWETPSQPVRSHNLMTLREQFESLHIAESYLRHETPYDEMIGLEKNEYGNRLEVPLGKHPYATPNWLN